MAAKQNQGKGGGDWGIGNRNLPHDGAPSGGVGAPVGGGAPPTVASGGGGFESGFGQADAQKKDFEAAEAKSFQ